MERSRGPGGHGRDPHPAQRHRRRPPRGRRGFRAGRPRGQGRAGRRRRRPTGRRPGPGVLIRFGAQPDHRGAYGAELPAAHVRHRDADRPLRPGCGRDQGAHSGHAQDGAGPARPGQVRGHRRRRPQPPPRSRGDGPAQGEPHRRGGRGDRRDRGGQARDGARRADRGERCRGADRHTGRRGPRRRSPLDHARQHAGGRHGAGREAPSRAGRRFPDPAGGLGPTRLDTVLAIAGTGVDLISVGASTPSH
ncbi:hypothetical protein SUDANB52_04391 [Streptomyces sp. SudanB52_2052]